MRPQKLDICLAQFATIYENCAKPKKVEFKDDMSMQVKTLQTENKQETEESFPWHIRLSNCTYMKLRTVPSVLRIHSSKKKKGNEHFYSEMILYLPWRNEEDEKTTDELLDSFFYGE